MRTPLDGCCRNASTEDDFHGNPALGMVSYVIRDIFNGGCAGVCVEVIGRARRSER